MRNLSARNLEAYWATLPALELAPFLATKVEEHDRFLVRSGLYDLYDRSAEMCQSGLVYSRIMKGGKRGQYDLIRINDYGNIFRHILNGTVGSRPTWQPRAINADFESQAQTKDCEGLLEYESVDKNGEERQNECIEDVLAYGDGFRLVRWDPNRGRFLGYEPTEDDVSTPEGQGASGSAQVLISSGTAPTPGEDGEQEQGRPIYAGEIRDDTVHTTNVIRDWTRKTWAGTKWVIVRQRENRHDLAALNKDDQQKHDRILGLEREGSSSTLERPKEIAVLRTSEPDNAEIDDVWVYHFIHERTPAIPFGRWVTYVDDETILDDTDFDELGIDKMDDVLLRACSAEIKGLPAGYTFMFDLMAIQDAVNVAESIAFTTLSKFGLQHITGPAGAILKQRVIAEGLSLIELGGVREGKIEALNLMALPEIVLTLIDRWRKAMEVLSGVNSVARGDPEAQLKSGAALALVQSQFIAFTAGYQRSYAVLWERYGTSLVKLFKHNVPEARLAAIVGKGASAYVKELKSENIDKIDRVRVDIAPLLSRTAAGRREIANDLLERGLIGAPEYFHVMETGELNSILHDETAELMFIQKENERLMDGRGTEALIDDNHELHQQKHRALLFNPDVRERPEIVEAVHAHMLDHKRLAMEQLMEQQMGLPPPMPGAPIELGGQAPTPDGGLEQGTPGMPAGEGAGMPPGGEQIPLPAINPATGAPAQVRMPAPSDAFRGIAA